MKITNINSATRGPNPQKEHPFGTRTIMDLFDVSPAVAITSLSLAVAVVVIAVLYFIHSAPPTSITISSGPEGSAFYKNAVKYAAILKRSGVTVNVKTSEGSIENLKRLSDPNSNVDLGLIQAGITAPNLQAANELVSLGSISYQPLLIFYGGAPIELLSQLKGKKIAVGPEGSGARTFALALLAANGIKADDVGAKDDKSKDTKSKDIKSGDPKPSENPLADGTTLLDWEADVASKALLEHKIDAAFIMSESASVDILHTLMHSDKVRLFNVKQANGYSRKIDYLNVLELPEGAIDFGQNIPAHDVSLVGPTVELVATKDLHPALSDLILEAATEVHSRPGVFQKRGEFPMAVEHGIHLSADAARFYKSGKSLLYRILPFALASLLSRIVVVFLPMLVILLPAMRSIPAFFRWKTQNKIYRRYSELLEVEQRWVLMSSEAERERLRHEFIRIEDAVNKMKLPASFADQYYGLRGHIDYVKQMLVKIASVRAE